MDKHVILPLGTWDWAYGLIASIILGGMVLYISAHVDEDKKEKIRLWKALILFIWFIAFYIYAIYDGSFSLQTSLPLHLCALSYMLGLVALITKKQFAFEFVAYLGIAGGINSLITPEFAHGYDRFYHIQYYFEHGGIVLMPIFLGIAYGMKPRKWSWLRIIIPVNILAVIIYCINLGLNSNYMYVNIKPIADNPFLIGDWPYYIFFLELVLLLHTYIIYICFHRFKRWV